MKKETKEKTKKEDKTPSSMQSFMLFKSGKDIEEIATTRGLSKSTVWNHIICYFGEEGFDINRLIPNDKAETIRKAFKDLGDDVGLKPIKEALGDDYSYDEIRLIKREMM